MKNSFWHAKGLISIAADGNICVIGDQECKWLHEALEHLEGKKGTLSVTIEFKEEE